MRISVIVPFLNEERYIEQCLTALRGQAFPQDEYELIFVDNGSCDRSVDLVKRYPAITLLEERKPGPYAARNRGLAVARGELIAFTDADCVPARDWLTQICTGLTRTGAAIALGRQRFPAHGPGVMRMCEDYEETKVEYVLSQCTKPQHIFAFTNNMALRAEVVRTLGPFVEWMRGADVEYIQRYLLRFPRDRVVYMPGMTVTHLEIKRLKAWLGKQATYGQSTRRIEQETPYRPLGYRERLHVYRHCVNTNRYTVWRKACLLGVLGLGVLCFKMGRIRGRPEPIL